MSSKPAMQRSSVVLPQPGGPEQTGYATGLDAKTDPIDDGVRSVALDDSCEFKVGHQCLFING
jgi:hypothetical protein